MLSIVNLVLKVHQEKIVIKDGILLLQDLQ